MKHAIVMYDVAEEVWIMAIEGIGDVSIFKKFKDGEVAARTAKRMFSSREIDMYEMVSSIESKVNEGEFISAYTRVARMNIGDIVSLAGDVDSRWKATINYRSKNGTVDVEYFFEEFDDLADIVERGPDWNTIDSMTVTLNRSTGKLYVEAKI